MAIAFQVTFDADDPQRLAEFWALTLVLFAFALIVAELIGMLEKRIEFYAGVRQ